MSYFLRKTKEKGKLVRFVRIMNFINFSKQIVKVSSLKCLDSAARIFFASISLFLARDKSCAHALRARVHTHDVTFLYAFLQIMCSVCLCLTTVALEVAIVSLIKSLSLKSHSSRVLHRVLRSR